MFAVLRSKVFLALVVAVVAILFLIGSTQSERPAVSRVEQALSDALAPFQYASSRAGHWLSGTIGAFSELRGARDENRLLKAQLADRSNLETRLEELKAANRVLHDQLKLTANPSYRYLSAEVIDRQPDNWFRSIVINRGSRDGVKKDMAVVTPEGLVGRITRVSATTSTVMIITDRDSGIGGRNQVTRDAGVMTGLGNGNLEIKFFSPNAQLALDDDIVTSGLGSVYPKGIKIGDIVSLRSDNNGLSKYAVVKPSVNFQSLEYVMVVTSAPAPEDPPEPAIPPGGAQGGTGG